MKLLPLLLILFPVISQAQLLFKESVDLGTITEAYEIKGDILITNNNSAKTFLMRADADQGVKIYTSKKTLLPGDTCLLVISFIPETKGTFNKSIRLVSSDREKPYKISLSGNLLKKKQDDKLACFYFGNRRSSPVPTKEEPMFVQTAPIKRDVTNKIPDRSKEEPSPSEPVVNSKPPAPSSQPASPQKKETVTRNTTFSEENYKANNIIFLVDVSGSMKDSLKLPLMKKALHHLIDEIRNVDKLTFITYADTIKTLTEAGSAAEKEKLHLVVDGLKAKGMTKGRKAIFYSQQVAQNNFIEGGNNQIIIATDGEFKFEKADEKLWKERQGEKKIVLSTVAFGTDKEAIKNLKDLAKKGEGSFLQITNRADSEAKLMDEIKARSRK